VIGRSIVRSIEYSHDRPVERSIVFGDRPVIARRLFDDSATIVG